MIMKVMNEWQSVVLLGGCHGDGVRVTCVAGKSGLGRTKEVCVFSVEILGLL